MKLTVIVAVVAAVGMAWFTKDWERPTPVRIHERGRRFLASGPPNGKPSIDNSVAPDPEPVAADRAPDRAPVAPPPRPKPKPIELKTVTDISLCEVDKALDPEFRRSCEIHVDMEGALSWHAGGKTVELQSFKSLRSGLDQKSGVPDVIFAPDKMTNWQELRFMVLNAQKTGRGQFWLGVAKTGEPTKLRVLSMEMPDSEGTELPAEDAQFKVFVKEGQGGKMYVEVQGKEIADFPVDLALAWADWKKAHPDADTFDPSETPVVLEAHRFTPCYMVANVIDVLRGLGIECQHFTGELGRPRR
jgi:hypothetical protein